MKWFVRAVLLPGIICAGWTLPLKADSGADLYKSNCVICHGSDASGNTAIGKKNKVKDLKSPEVQKATDAELADLISKGKKPMPAFADRLKPEQVHEIVEYLRELAKKK
jgi:cytochrome c oxidase cbb3-type subunit III